VTPEINAASTILIGLVTTGVIIASLLQKRRAARSNLGSRGG
jgi:putrescine transport system permease protein